MKTEAQTSQKGLLGRRGLELQKRGAEITESSRTTSKSQEDSLSVSAVSNPARRGHRKCSTDAVLEETGGRELGETQLGL